jgi:ATP-dependent Lon protease
VGLLEAEIDILQVEKRIRGRVKRQMEKSQREYYLNEQVKAIQKELGEGEDQAEIEELEKDQGSGHVQRGHGEGRGRAQEAQDDVADVG